MRNRKKTRRSSALERLGTAHLAQAQLNALLDTLSKREMIVVRDTLGFWNGVPQPWIVTAEALAISPSEVGRIQRAAIDKLSAAVGPEALRDLLGNGLGVSWQDPRIPLSELDFGPGIGVLKSRPDIVWCPRHGWGAGPTTEDLECPCCPCTTAVGTGALGRPRIYCSQACKQAAWRGRSKKR